MDLDTLERVVREIIEDYAKHNCVYIEIRSTPKAFGSVSTMADYVERVLKAVREGEEAESGRIRVRYIASISRQGTVE